MGNNNNKSNSMMKNNDTNINMGNNNNKSNSMMKNNDININNCYINSSLQTLLHLEEFITDVRSIYIKKDKEEKMKLTFEFKKLINQYLKENILKTIDPLNIKKILSEVNEKYKTNHQQDANEFITFFLNQMMDEVKGFGINNIKPINPPTDEKGKTAFEKLEDNFFAKKKSFLIDLFYGRLKKEILCPKDHVIKVSFEVYNMIQLPNIDDKKGNNKQEYFIEEYLTKFQDKRSIQGEILCNECHKSDIYYSKTTIYNFPYYIILLLNNQSIKYNEHFTIEVINYIESENQKKEKYELVGVIGYYGNYKRGHYFSKCKLNENKWVYYHSDKYVTEKNYLQINNTDAILFYQKVKTDESNNE